MLLDVRGQSEWQAGHVPGAMHIPLHELSARMGEIPGGEIWVHCQAGYRAAVAASLLAAAGRQVVAINDDLSSALPLGAARRALVVGLLPWPGNQARRLGIMASRTA